jgi:hypothetical protein
MQLLFLRLLRLSLFNLMFLNLPVRPAEATDFEIQLDSLVEKISADLKARHIETALVGAFASSETLDSGAGTGIRKVFADGLTRRGIRATQGGASVTGTYRTFRSENGRMEGLSIDVRIVEAGSPDKVIEGRIPFIPQDESAQQDSARSLAPLLGLTAVLPADEGWKQRLQKCHDGTEKPRVHVDQTRLSAAAESPYSIQILVGEARTPTVRGGRAYVDLKRNEQYVVRLINDSEQPAATTLSIDGLSLFEFSENRNYQFVVVPPKSSAELRGWHRTNEKSEAFEVTSYSKSAAAELRRDSPRVGSITATFAACWPKETSPPKDERSANLVLLRGDGRLATGRGPLLESGFKEVEMHAGEVRAAVTVRYDRPQPE